MFDLGGTSLAPKEVKPIEQLDPTAAAATQKTKEIPADTGDSRVSAGGDGLYIPPAEREPEADPLEAIAPEVEAEEDQQAALDAIAPEGSVQEETEDIQPEAEQLGDYAEVMTTMVDSEFLVADQEKEYTPDALGFQELIRDNIEAGREGYHKVDELPGEVQDYLKAKTLDENLKFTEFIDNEVFEEDYSLADPNNEQHQESLLAEWGKARGDSPEDIAADIASYKANGTAGRRAATAKSQLINAQEERFAEKEKAFEAANLVRANKEKSEIAKFTADVMGMTSVNGIKLTQADKIALVAYETVKVGPKGETQAQLDASFENKVFALYAQKNKLNMDKVARKADTKSNIKLNKTLRLKNDVVARPKTSSPAPVKKSNNDISAINWSLGKK